jgi:hypothetical protein
MESRKNVKAPQVKRELLSEQSPSLLKELHLLTREGHLNADSRRKLKQVNHLYQLIQPALDDLFSRSEDVTMIDVGAGRAYLGFIVYELAFKKHEKGRIISIEERPELVKTGREMATRLEFSRMEFVDSKVAAYQPPERVHLVTALHACDTATDDALLLGLRVQADYIAVVPCCQAEAAQLLKQSNTSSAVHELWGHGIHRREFGSHVTNVMRALTLESLGYQVTVTELVGWEHSLKNEFIMAKRVQRENPKAKARLQELVSQLDLKPKIVRELFP